MLGLIASKIFSVRGRATRTELLMMSTVIFLMSCALPILDLLFFGNIKVLANPALWIEPLTKLIEADAAEQLNGTAATFVRPEVSPDETFQEVSAYVLAHFPLTIFGSIFLWIPHITVRVRRFHDVGLSGFLWALPIWIAFAGGLFGVTTGHPVTQIWLHWVILICMVINTFILFRRGETRKNDYGHNPRGTSGYSAASGMAPGQRKRTTKDVEARQAEVSAYYQQRVLGGQS